MEKKRNKTPLFIRIANGRFKKWKEYPEQMELIRQNAIKIASKRRHERTENLKELIQSWPKELDTDSFRNMVSRINYNVLVSCF